MQTITLKTKQDFLKELFNLPVTTGKAGSRYSRDLAAKFIQELPSHIKMPDAMCLGYTGDVIFEYATSARIEIGFADVLSKRLGTHKYTAIIDGRESYFNRLEPLYSWLKLALENQCCVH